MSNTFVIFDDDILYYYFLYLVLEISQLYLCVIAIIKYSLSQEEYYSSSKTNELLLIIL